MTPPEIFRLPNLLSLSRVLIAPIIGYYIWRGDSSAAFIALALLGIAGVTDGLDGYLARRLDRVTSLGIALDPICDKILAGVLVIFLILYREFPIWLAAVIVGRDLLIVIAGSFLIRRSRLSLPSNLSGKYAFTAITVLLGSYVIRFEFGITLTTYATVVLIAVSLISYGKVFVTILRSAEPPQFKDSFTLRMIRTTATIIYTIVYFYRLYSDVIR